MTDSVAPPSSSPACDPEGLLRMLNGDRDSVRDLVQTFLDNFPQLLGELDQALAESAESGMPEPLRRTVHRIKGVCAIFATGRIVARAREIEALLLAGAVPAGVDESALWREELQQVAAEMTAFNRSLAAVDD
ncbi:HPt domain-containing protein [Azospira oryzae PS]|jgi:HPt (histidine-containing phosphotransfer) domain-containing protein|uniref:HPt domain-containing protein n=1 Tax=Azospira oryzae (strain ATCC BAA-33 / DSM 13638 / PS) TaxID=640081 RepID=G8QH92_AZOOP|nr:Hpt domain-containing protein [Azospira oryzae]AEV26237.1 HPt domain-containing protein [Azospira oryzae PS]